MTPYRENEKPLDTKPVMPNTNPKFGMLKSYSDGWVFYVRQHPERETQDITKQFATILEAISSLDSEGWKILYHNPELNQLFFVNHTPPVYEYADLEYCSNSNISSNIGYTLRTGRYTETDLRRFNRREVLNWLSKQGWEPVNTEFKMFRRIVKNRE
jgi:hypothetical protein